MITLNTVRIARIGSGKAVRFASDELAKYLGRMDENALVETRIYDRYDPNIKNVLWVGETDDSDIPEVENKKLDDGILIDVENFCGKISGTNPRAVLIAAYRFLRELGVRWVRPGKNGEIIPHYVLSECFVKVKEVPSYRHRCICIEGSISYEHVYNIIDWLPKAGMNGYLIQFHTPYTFFNRWCTHEHNPMLETTELTHDDVSHIQAKIAEDITDRGLLYHAVGHGWTCESFGIPGGTWQEYEGEIPEDTKQYLAELDGVRGLYKGVPLNTQLCYTNPKVLEKVADAVCDYCTKHPEIDYLHVWLADGQNNHCECENCKDMRPSDMYIKLLNKVDEKLTEKGIDTHIVAIAYTDLLWAPQTEKLTNPERVLLMFAPITRNFFDSYDMLDPMDLGEAPKFSRNNVTLPSSVKESVRLLSDWQDMKVYSDSCDFDYHLWTAQVRDIGKYGISEILHRDIKALERIGLNGYVSCQVQRSSFPNNLPMHSMASALWNKEDDFGKMSDTYMSDCYGKHYKRAVEYLQNISYLLSPGFKKGFDGDANLTDSERYEMATEALGLTREFNVYVTALLKRDNFAQNAHRTSWQYLLYTCEIAEIVSNIYIKRFGGASYEEQQVYVDCLSAYYDKIEPHVHRDFDVWRSIPTKWYKYFIPNTKPEQN